ncbi:inositol monophosphatase family protein [Corynebacterium pelargi]|uniref:Inositol-1-monophosphatase n=1 Tax=Corynebacterium pelargi TaxID=1471400 RepID=A0A410WAX3_9CORY|nr:inositol monophosphatase family protein [Corynebacterium pelargi]QAU53080.1 Inositol-1-monophosphatase SuhB [Corynebacterium pelargi]GGG75001.1 putative inositol-1-monophosphatase SuhB [Corynebacterium pelargi]
MIPSTHPDATLAFDAAQAAAKLIRARRAEYNLEALGVEHKSSSVDPVTVVDKESEQLIATCLREYEPEVAILGEESQAGGSHSGNRRWIVDPIDGTVNFLYDSQAYAVSIALEVAGAIEVGVVCDVPADTTYLAVRDEGAWRFSHGQWQRVSCSQPKSLASTLVATGFSYVSSRRDTQGELLAHLLGQVRDIRRFGSAALDLCRVAEGSVDAYYEHGLNPWDFAAGSLIAAEAGAVCTVPTLDTFGDQPALLCAAAPSIAQELAALLPQDLKKESISTA